MTANTPVHKMTVTAEEITAAEAYYAENKAEIIANARMGEETALQLHGAYLGHRQQQNWGAAAWLVYRAAVYQHVTEVLGD